MQRKRENERLLKEETHALKHNEFATFWIDQIKKNATPPTAALAFDSITARALSRVLGAATCLLSLSLANEAQTGAYIDDSAGVFLAKALAGNTVLTNLNLASNMLGPKSARALGDMLTATSTIKHLNLEGNPLSVVQLEDANGSGSGGGGGGGGGGFAKRTGGGNSSGLDDNGSSGLSSPKKVVLDFSGIQHFARCLEENTSLAVLNLTRCMLHEEGGAAIAKSMDTNDTVVALEISYSGISAVQSKEIKATLNRNMERRDKQVEDQRELERVTMAQAMVEQKKREVAESKRQDEEWLESERNVRCNANFGRIEVERAAWLEEEKQKHEAEMIKKHQEHLLAAKNKKKKKKGKKGKKKK